MRSILLLILTLLAGCSSDLRPFEYGCIRMGTRARVVVYASDAARAEAAVAAAWARMAEVEAVLSDWQEDGPVARLRDAAPGTWVEVDPMLDEALGLAQAVATATGGAFDPACGRMTAAWREARRDGGFPADWAAWTTQHGPGASRLTRRPGAIRFDTPVPWLDFGGIGKGYAADQALATLRGHGLAAAMVEIGGELALGDPPPGGRGWRVTGAAAAGGGDSGMVLSRCGVATSGGGAQSLTSRGQIASHVMDPRTGRWLGRHDDITVVAPSAAEADALASAGCVLGREALQRRVRARTDVRVY